MDLLALSSTPLGWPKVPPMPGKQRRSEWGEVVGERLAQALEQRLNQRELAKKLGRTEGVVSLWISGHIPDGWKMVRDVCREAGISADQLLGLSTAPKREPPPADAAAPVPQEWIPLIANVAAGEPMVDPRSEAEDWYSFKSKWIRGIARKSGTPIERFFAVKIARGAQGESMLPTIQPGSSLVVDPGPENVGIASIEDGAIYLCKPGGGDGWTVKRAWMAEKSRYLVFKGDNPAQGAIVEDMKGRSLREVIVGRVVYLGQEIA